MSAGEVWIDDIQLFDMWIQPKESNALLIASELANRNLVEYAKVTHCRQFLESYWPRFLLEHVTSPDQQPDALRTAAQPTADASSTPNSQDKSTIDHVREMIPKVPLKVPFKR
jgi:hypothetical protein